MTHTQTVLRCDGCRVAFPAIAESRNSDRHQEATMTLRDRARKAGWCRCRLTTTGAIGDYCPDCQRAPKSIRKT